MSGPGLHKQIKEIICKICDRYNSKECNGDTKHTLQCIVALRNYHMNTEIAKITAAKELGKLPDVNTQDDSHKYDCSEPDENEACGCWVHED